MTSPTLPQPPALLSPHPARSSACLHWLLWLALLGAQFALFHRYATREITWAYPRHCDQAVYLERAYDAYLHMAGDGFWRGLAFSAGFNGGDPNPNGALLHLQAALLFRVFGPSRLAALTLVFGYFAAFQAMLFSTLHAITRRWPIAWVGMGLLLAARTTFQETGGIMDFRGDFSATCLFGIFLCCVVRSNVFQQRGWSMAAGAVAAFTMAVRFITLAYFIPVFGLTLLLLVFCRVRAGRQAAAMANWNQRLRNLVIAGVLGSVLIGPVLLHHQQAISNYYIRLHTSGQNRYERAAMYHVMDWGASLKYYPQSLYLHHCGLAFVGLAAVLLAAGALLPAARRGPAVSNNTDRRLAVAFALTALLVPLAALNWDVDKGPSVGDIMVQPVLWLVLLLARFPLDHAGGAFSKRWRCAWPAAAMTTGIAVQITSYLHHSDLTRHRPQTLSILAMYDAIGASAAQHGWTDLVVADDALSEYQFPAAMDVTIYERHGLLLHSREALATNLIAKSREQVFSAVGAADYVLLSEPLNAGDEQDSFERSAQAVHADLLAYCRSHLTHLCDCRAVDRQVTVFVREKRP